jgi:hypothetical protein
MNMIRLGGIATVMAMLALLFLLRQRDQQRVVRKLERLQTRDTGTRADSPAATSRDGRAIAQPK